jgi:glycosyltransferase involved in cell wall biosynthesis
VLVFITSLKHPVNCHSYERVSALLDQTLDSVCAQTDPNFQVVVVCNEVPTTRVRPNVHYVTVDFPPPSDLARPETGMPAIRRDRGTKYVIGLLFADRFKPDYVMFFDYDDYVANRLVNFVHSQPPGNGWYFSRGYVYKQGSYTLSRTRHFYNGCGTSSIVGYRHISLPKNLNLASTQQQIEQSVNQDYLYKILGSHKHVRNYYREQGAPLHELPFIGAVWVLGNGENHSGKEGSTGDIALSAEICAEFNIRRVRKAVVVNTLLELLETRRRRLVASVGEKIKSAGLWKK